MKSIGIDLGTTTISGVVLEIDSGMVLESRTIANNNTIHTRNSWEHLQDAGKIIQAAQSLLEDFLQLHPDVSSIGLTGQMHGIVYLNDGGKVISPLYTWQDGRGNLPGDDGRTLTEEILDKTGLPVYTGYGLVTHLWLSRADLIPKDATALCTIADAFGIYLTGRKKPLLHISNAASLGFYDVRDHQFCLSVLELMNIDKKILPDTTDHFSLLGTWRGIPVAAAIGDNQASFLGTVGLQNEVLLLNIGTGGQVSVMSDVSCDASGIETRPLTRDRWLLVGSSLCGGSAYAVLERFFHGCAQAFGLQIPEQDMYSVMETMGRRGNERELVFSTAFQGTRENPNLMGSISGLRADNFTPENLIRSALEGIAGELYGYYRSIQSATGIHAKKIIASGNALRHSPLLRETCSSMFSMPVELTTSMEEAACGAAVSGTKEI